MLDSKKVQKVLTVILEGLIYLSFLMPFIFIDQSIFPFIVGKILYFQAIVQLMAVVYILLLVINFEAFKPKKSLLLYWFGFYALSILLSAIFGADFNRAFWSNFERMTGVFMVFHCIAYAIMVSVILNTPAKIKRAIQVLLGVSLLQVFVCLEQYVKPGVYLYANKGGRVWGTLGNSIYIGSYFLFHIFFALYLAIKEKKQIWQIIYLSIAILESYIIIHSESSRGADLAYLFAVVFIIFAYAFLSKSKKIQLGALAVIIGGILAVSGIFIFQNTRIVKHIPLADKIISLPATLQEGTGATRMIAWEIAWKSFKERPVFGWGLENFYHAFNQHYNPESLRYSYYETWFDRSHSVIFDTISSGGAVGAVSYFGLFVVGGYLLISAWRKGVIDKHALIFFPVIFGTYLIQILFVFDHPASYLLLYFSFGVLLALLSPTKELTEPKYEFSGFSFFMIACVVMILFLILFFGTSVRTYKAAVGIIDAERTFVNNYKNGLLAYKDILFMKTPFIDDMRAVMAKRVGGIDPSTLQSNPDYREAILFAREEMMKEVGYRTIDVYDYIILGQLDMLLAAAESKYYQSADDFFAKARELSPKRQQIYYSWARNKAMQGDMAGAEALLKEALSFDEKIPDSWWYLGLVYNGKGRNDLAWDCLMKADGLNYQYKAAGEIYLAIGLGEKLQKYQELIGLYNKAINTYVSPPTAQLYIGLAQAYQKLGNIPEAVNAFSKAKDLNPDLFKK